MWSIKLIALGSGNEVSGDIIRNKEAYGTRIDQYAIRRSEVPAYSQCSNGGLIGCERARQSDARFFVLLLVVRQL